MTDESKQDWDTATWEGNRKTQLRASLKLSAKERFEALEELADASNWLTDTAKIRHDLAAPGQKQSPHPAASGVREQHSDYDSKADRSNKSNNRDDNDG